MAGVVVSDRSGNVVSLWGKGMSLSVILGPAGSGKSTTLRERAGENPNYAKVAATTGIAAVNLGPGVTTMHSALGFFNEESASDALQDGRLSRKFIDIARQGYSNFVIDEMSMMTAPMLEIITRGAVLAGQHCNKLRDEGKENITPCGLILVGDFLQLGPVKGPYAFFGRDWPEYEKDLTQLTTIYRQSDPVFLEALNLARAGSGVSAVMALKKAGVEFVEERNDYYEGTTLTPTNDMANKLNETRFNCISSPARLFPSHRWGKESGEWRDIPDAIQMKVGAFAMVLANEPGTFSYVNGDTGRVISFDEHTMRLDIRRNDGSRRELDIPYCMRTNVQKDKPDGVAEFSGFLVDGRMFRLPKDIDEAYDLMEEAGFEDKETMDKIYRRWFAQFFSQYDAYVDDAMKRRVPYYSIEKQRWVIGWIQYMPIRLAWASTVHKAQGLTLDNVQIDARNRFAGSPAMMYVALSRCKTPQNIRIVASPFDFARRIQTARECLRWV